MPEINANILLFNPHVITKRLMLDGAHVILRLLLPGDGELLGHYFEGLSDETRRRYAPHPLTVAEAHHLCARLERHSTLRLVALLPGEAPQIIAYFILALSAGEHETARYAEYGITLDSSVDCTFAPSVADAYQSRGLGSLLMPHVLEVARRMGKRSLVLMGGTQATNTRAVRFYEKFEFERVGSYFTEIENYDMILYLA